MMGKVSHLPDSMVRAWRVYERKLRAALRAEGCTAAEIHHACTELMPLYLEHAKPKSFDSSDPDALVAELNRWVRAQVSGLLSAVAVREVAIFRITGGGRG